MSRDDAPMVGGILIYRGVFMSAYKLKQNYLIRTVTMYYVGTLESVDDHELVLSSCSWVADTGRYNKALTTGELNEVEPMPGPVIVGRGAVVDAVEWTHELPTQVK